MWARFTSADDLVPFPHPMTTLKKPHGVKLAALLMLTLGCSIKTGLAAEYELRMYGNGKAAATERLVIEGGKAVVTTGDKTEHFDLGKMAWLDEADGRWISARECAAVLDKTREDTRVALAAGKMGQAPAGVAAFLGWALNPSYKSEKSDGALRLTSGQVDYLIDGEAARTDTDDYYKYAILNSYKKAILLKKLPPYPELRAIDEMRKLGYVPKKISVSIPAIPGSPVVDIEISKVSR